MRLMAFGAFWPGRQCQYVGGGNELVECLGGGVVAGGSGAVARFVGDGVVGEALVAGHFLALVPGQCAHRPVGQALDVAGERAGPGRLRVPETGPQ